MRFVVKFKWILPGILGVFGSLLISFNAYAGTLQNWRFDGNANRLVLVTDDGVQPRAQLIADPTRLVIDLPGIRLGQSTLRQSVGGAVREVRVGQFDAETTRVVIELNPGYTVDPQQIVIRGATANEWTVQLPTPQFVGVQPTPPRGNPSTPTPTSPVASTPSASGLVQIEDIQEVPDGFFIRTTGGTPRVGLSRNRRRTELRMELRDSDLAGRLGEGTVRLGRSGVDSLELERRRRNRIRMTLNLSDPDSNWIASVSPNGITLIRSRLSGDRVVAGSTPTPIPVATTPSPSQPPTTRPPTQQPPPTRPPASGQISQIQSVELSQDGDRLLIRADQPFTYRAERERGSSTVNIIIPSARLADRIPDPQLSSNSPLQRVRLRQETNQSVVIQVEPSSNVTVGEVNQVSGQILAIELQRPRPQATPPNRPNVSSPGNLPNVRSGLVVVIDPGHGGVDPGAVGIGGLKEEDIVLDVGLKVAQLLEQQGVRVVMTRQSDQGVDLEPRVQIAESARADIFVSIHANALSMSRPDVNGIETFYSSPEGARLGRVIHDNMIQFSGMNDRGLKSARFYVIRNTSMPAVLLEIGFVTGAQDAPQLADPEWRSQMSVAIARGILQYLSQNY
jgi:N-acetylmuramoyl-L-alanine amidase